MLPSESEIHYNLLVTGRTLTWTDLIPAWSWRLEVMVRTQELQVMPSTAMTVVLCVTGRVTSNPMSSIASRIFSGLVRPGLYTTRAFLFSRLTCKCRWVNVDITPCVHLVALWIRGIPASMTWVLNRASQVAFGSRAQPDVCRILTLLALIGIRDCFVHKARRQDWQLGQIKRLNALDCQNVLDTYYSKL